MREELIRLTLLTLQTPGAGAKAVLTKAYPREFLWALLGLATILSVLMVQVMRYAFPQPEDAAPLMPFQSSPVLFALIMWGSLVLMVFCVYYIGRAFGGTGSFQDSLTAVIWLQFLLMVSQVLQFLIATVSMGLAALLGIGFLVYWIWIFATFVAVLHAFENRAVVLGGMFAALMGVMMGLSLITSLIAILFGVEMPIA